eukprot:4145117-Amphidinium_carterae.2
MLRPSNVVALYRCNSLDCLSIEPVCRRNQACLSNAQCKRISSQQQTGKSRMPTRIVSLEPLPSAGPNRSGLAPEGTLSFTLRLSAWLILAQQIQCVIARRVGVRCLG